MQKSKRYISGTRKNNRIAFKNRLLTVMLLAVIIILVFCGFKTNASTRKADSYTYHTITVESGDTLWNIAEEYADQSDDSVEDYIQKLEKMNALAGSDIQAGQTLLVYYYE